MFDKKEFVDSVIQRELSTEEIIKAAREEIARTESSPYGVKGASENRAADSGKYLQFLGSVGLFLQSGTMPGGVSENDFWLLHRLAKYLVELRNFKPTILELFGTG